ncbi:MAG: hypothetical protein F6K19_31495 [Cyanothece sp. SIO1E1]|nr:hypothetical protein [Cyanothece sp. SIO1E1]
MEEDKIIQVSAFPDWIVGVSYARVDGYRCWVITPELKVLNDGEIYGTSHAAMSAGRYLVEHSLEREQDNGRNRTCD